MANTYSQIYFHIVFAVKWRRNAVAREWKNDLYKYITGIVKNNNQKLMIINGMPDHVHLLIGTKPNCNLSHLVRDIKSDSSKWINKNGYLDEKFLWQGGFGAFSVGQSQLQRVINYIKNQESHHTGKTFRQEYVHLLKINEIDFKPEYIFTED
ncbi:IS200/IS605 family transposase [Arenibacter latericius]|uniref:IS200/IS605 family transposase n=1 Tax=Arenibacter latericius TaxID=86104 RepID=UPI0003F78B25|nr:IS200/IS605 family transposase [Arenibacter latericius]MDX1363622.1 IS200/IS605 family transposase [Arenibacter latericius]